MRVSKWPQSFHFWINHPSGCPTIDVTNYTTCNIQTGRETDPLSCLTWTDLYERPLKCEHGCKTNYFSSESWHIALSLSPFLLLSFSTGQSAAPPPYWLHSTTCSHRPSILSTTPKSCLSFSHCALVCTGGFKGGPGVRTPNDVAECVRLYADQQNHTPYEDSQMNTMGFVHISHKWFLSTTVSGMNYQGCQ